MDNLDLLRTIYRAGDEGSWDLLLDVYAPTFSNNGVEMTARAWRDAVAAFYAAFDDVRHDIHDVGVDGERVWCRSTMHGSHARVLMLGDTRYEPTGNRVTLTGLELRRIRDGRVVELWSAFDFATFVAQLS